MNRSLTKLYAQLAALDPLEEDASDNSRKNLKDVYKLTGLLHLHACGLMSASSMEPDDEWDDPDLLLLEKLEITPQSRLVEVKKAQGKSCVTIEEWATEILQAKKRTMFVAEQEGMAKLLRGYEQGDSVDISANIGPLNGGFEEMCAKGVEIEKENQVIQARMLAREGLIQTTDRFQAYIYSLLNSIHALKFAFEWKELSRKDKDAYVGEVLEVINPDFGDWSQAEFIKKAKIFRHRHDKVVKARKDLKRLFDQFHAAVLLDPSWTPKVSYGSSTTGRTPTFPQTLNDFLNDGEEVPAEYKQRSSEVLMEVLRVIAPGTVEDYVKEFLDNHNIV